MSSAFLEIPVAAQNRTRIPTVSKENAPYSHGLSRPGLPEDDMIAAHAITARRADVVLDIPQDDQGLRPVHKAQEGPGAQLVDQQLMRLRLNDNLFRKSVVMADILVHGARRMAEDPVCRNRKQVLAVAQGVDRIERMGGGVEVADTLRSPVDALRTGLLWRAGLHRTPSRSSATARPFIV